MKILFISPKMPLNLALGNMPPVGVLYIASFVEREGHEVLVYDRNNDKRTLSQVMKAFKPDIVSCTLMYTRQIRDMQSICIKLRDSRPGLPILCGGLTASLIPELVLKECLVDYVGIGEGEYTFLELLEVVAGRRDPSTVQSLVYLDKNNQPVHTPLRPFADLSNFPNTNYSLLPMEKYFVYFPGSSRMLPVYTSKGCPRQCTFCFSPVYHRCQYRVRKMQAVMREVESLVTEYGADGILFIDEMFGVDKENLRVLCEFMNGLSEKTGKRIRWACESCFGVLRYEDLKLMADAGCFLILFGLESGSPEMLKRIRKTYSLTRVDTDVNNCKAVGISVQINAILGFPDEKPAQVKQTIHAIFRLNPTIYCTAIFYMVPGTAEYEKIVASGRIKPPDNIVGWSKLEERQFLIENYSAISDRELKVILYFFYWRTMFQNRQDQTTSRLAFVKIGFLRVMDNIGRKGFFSFFAKYFRLAFTAAWYYYAYPGIRKKYDLYPCNFGRKDWEDLGHFG